MSLKNELFNNLEQIQELYESLVSAKTQVERVHLLREQEFCENYGDYLDQSRYKPALSFILSDVYSSLQHQQRDEKLAKAFQSMNRILPETILQIIAKAITYNKDMLYVDTLLMHQMAESHMQYSDLFGSSELVERRKKLVHDFVELTNSIHIFVKKPFMQMTLKASRIPARAANLMELQDFLERCFAVFKSLRNPQAFLIDYQQRELKNLE